MIVDGAVNQGPYGQAEMTFGEPRFVLANKITAWVRAEMERGRPIPDFWVELETLLRLAEFLVASGWCCVAPAVSP